MATNTVNMDVQCDLLQFVDSQFGENIKSLEDAEELLIYTEEEHHLLEEQVSTVNQERASKIKKTLIDSSKASLQVEQLTNDHKQLKVDVIVHLDAASPLRETVTTMLKQVNELEKCMQYMKWLSLVQHLSSEIQGALLVNSTPFQFHSDNIQESITAGAMPSAVNHFARLVEVSMVLQHSACYKLLEFVNTTILFWYKILKDKLSSEFEDILKALGWPIVIKAALLKPSQTSKEVLQGQLETLFAQLLKLQLPDALEDEHMSTTPGSKSIILPIQLLLKPLTKRFRYHFYGKKQTNNPDKPEFYLTQALNWIRVHSDFLDSNIQPILDKEQMEHINARMEFCHGLIDVVVTKAQQDMAELLFDDHLLSHFIDEILLFESELHSAYGYPAQFGCIHVLTEPNCFERWLAIEKKFAGEKMDSLLSANGAWNCQYEDISDIDELKVPECAESFITLMSVITDRYKTIPYPTNQLQFLLLQLDLLDDFRVRLLQVAKQEAHNPLSTVYCAITNSVSYVIRVLEEWADQLFFLQLQYHRAEEQKMFAFNQALESSGHINLLTQGEKHLDVMQNTVFDDILELYKLMQQDMCRKINTCVLNQLHTKAKSYLKEKWFSLPPMKDLICQAVTSSACEMFLHIKDHLNILQEQLCQPLFNITWHMMAQGINQFLYEEVILCNQFNEGGAAQIKFDMIRTLFPLFGAFTQRPDNYFKEIKEACILLNLKAGSAILLRDILFKHLHNNQQPNSTSPKSALNDVGVYRLKADAAERVMNLRTDWPKIKL